METLRNYLESMFRRYPETPEAERAKAELWQMMEDKYNELIAEGKKENEAVGVVIAEFGDLEEVADTLGIATMLQRVAQPTAAEGRTGAESASEGPTLVFGQEEERLNQAAEDRRVFADEAAKNVFGTVEETTVNEEALSSEESSAWQQSDSTAQERAGAWWAWHNDAQTGDTGEWIYRVLTAGLSVYWPTVTCIYLCWSFLTFHWWITWIIWPLAGILHSVLKRLILGDMTAQDGRTYKNRLLAAVLESYWPCVVFVYFAISFLTRAWYATWLIFIIAPFVRNFLRKTAVEEIGEGVTS